MRTSRSTAEGVHFSMCPPNVPAECAHKKRAGLNHPSFEQKSTKPAMQVLQHQHGRGRGPPSRCWLGRHATSAHTRAGRAKPVHASLLPRNAAQPQRMTAAAIGRRRTASNSPSTLAYVRCITFALAAGKLEWPPLRATCVDPAGQECRMMMMRCLGPQASALGSCRRLWPVRHIASAHSLYRLWAGRHAQRFALLRIRVPGNHRFRWALKTRC